MVDAELARRMGKHVALGKSIPAREDCTPIVCIVADACFSRPLKRRERS
jgi:hypothetical protein